MKIRYGIHRLKPKKKSENHALEIDGNWEDRELHKKIRKMIYEKHPGGLLHGYAKID